MTSERVQHCLSAIYSCVRHWLSDLPYWSIQKPGFKVPSHKSTTGMSQINIIPNLVT